MYDNEKKKSSIDWSKLISKLVVFAIVLVIGCLVYAGIVSNKKSKTVNTNTSSKTVAVETVETVEVVEISDADFIANINYLKDGALNYFNSDKLPSKNNETVKVTLKELLESKSLIDFTKNGKACSVYNSYAEATKVKNNQYEVKVQLECNNKLDYLVTYIETGSLAKTVVKSSANVNTKTSTPSKTVVTTTKLDVDDTNYAKEANKTTYYEYVEYDMWKLYCPEGKTCLTRVNPTTGQKEYKAANYYWTTYSDAGYNYTGKTQVK